MATVDLAPARDLTTITIRVPYGISNKGMAAVAVLAQLCAFESLEQGYKAGLENGKSALTSHKAHRGEGQ